MKVIKENYTSKWSELVNDKITYHQSTNEYSVAFDNKGKIVNIVNSSGSIISENSDVFFYFKNKYNA
jgi:hypothetical protein